MKPIVVCVWIFISFPIFMHCSRQDPKDARYARKQFYLGNDYFEKYMESLQKIDRLRSENTRFQREMASALQDVADDQTLIDIRQKKLQIQKNTDQITEETELSGRYLNAALEELNKSLVADPGYAQTHFLLGLIYLKKATTEIDISTRFQCMTGEALEEHQNTANQLLKKARQHFVKSAQDKQLASKSQNNIAAIDIHFGHYEEAVSAARMALEDLVYQEGHVARSNMGWAYFHMKKYENAIAQFTQALLAESKFCIARYRLARTYLESERTQEAISEFEKTLHQGFPCNGIQEAYLYVGLAYIKQSQVEDAARRFEECIIITPESCIALECKKYLNLLQQEIQKSNN